MNLSESYATQVFNDTLETLRQENERLRAENTWLKRAAGVPIGTTEITKLREQVTTLQQLKDSDFVEMNRLRAELADAEKTCDAYAAQHQRISDEWNNMRAERDALLKLLDEASPYVAQDDNGDYRKGRIETVLLEKIKNALNTRIDAARSKT